MSALGPGNRFHRVIVASKYARRLQRLSVAREALQAVDRGEVTDAILEEPDPPAVRADDTWPGYWKGWNGPSDNVKRNELPPKPREDPLWRPEAGSTKPCPQCGVSNEAAVIADAERMGVDLAAAGYEILPGGRVYEDGAAAALGMKPESLRKARARLGGPRWLKGEGRVLYDLRDVARYLRR